MKFTTTTSDLRDALERASKVVPKAPSQVVYTGVRMAVTGGHLVVTGSAEGETTVSVTVAVTEPSSGDKVVYPKPLLTLLAGLSPSTVLHVSAGTGPDLRVQPAGARPYTFRLLEATFPNTAVPAAHVHDVDLTHLATALRAVRWPAAKSGLVHVASYPDRVALHSTDGLRLASADLPGATFGDFDGLLPYDVLEQIASIGAVRVSLDRRGKVVTAASPAVTITTRVADETFPNVDSVLDNMPAQSVVVPVKETTRALARLASVADKRPIVLSIVGDEMTLSSPESSGAGSGAERLELPGPARAELTCALNMTYLREALDAHPTDMVTLSWSAADEAVFLTSSDPVPVTTVVMPFRV